MRELVVVLSDLYLSPESAGRPLAADVALPGLQHLTRFARRSVIEGGWRAWLARWLLMRDVLANAAPATVAVLATRPPSPVGQLSEAAAAPGAMVCMATPVHLVAGMSSVHLDIRGILRVDSNDQAALSEGFRRIFHDSGFVLEPLESGDFLLFGPQMRVAEGSEPARFLGESVAEVRKSDSSDPVLRRLNAEIEMWLHEHPVNAARTRRGEAPVTGLWLWGAGVASTPLTGMNIAGAAAFADDARHSSVDIAFGRDAYLSGLWASVGQKVRPLPQQLPDVFGYSHAQRAVLVIEMVDMLHSVPTWIFVDALAQIDRAFLSPAVAALQSGKLERLVLVVNDRELTLGRRDHLKLWRRTPTSLSGLQ